jgi:hypothetical protein
VCAWGYITRLIAGVYVSFTDVLRTVGDVFHDI